MAVAMLMIDMAAALIMYEAIISIINTYSITLNTYGPMED